MHGIGGFASIANQLADDYRLGELTRRMGLRTVLSDVVVETCVDERSFGELVRHELRWLRTIRAVRPIGYSCRSSLSACPWPASGACSPRGALPALALSASPWRREFCCIFVCGAQSRAPARRLLVLPFGTV